MRTGVRALTVRSVGAAVVAVLAGVLPAAVPAVAQPSANQIEERLDRAWEQIEPLIEQYNRVRVELAANQRKAAEVERKLRPLQLQVDVAQARVGEVAAEQYKTGRASGLNALLENGSPTTLGEQLALLDHLARDQRRTLETLSANRDRYAAEKTRLDHLVSLQRRQQAELAARKAAIEADIQRLERMRVAAAGTSTTSGGLRIGACPAVYIGGAAGTAVRTACAQIGDPYVFGAVGPNSFDCSGLTQFAWAEAGVSLTHYTGAQWTEGTAVSRSNARPGDLVFFYSDQHHVGMYVGNGLMVHASRTGVPVKMASIDNMPIAGFRRVG